MVKILSENDPPIFTHKPGPIPGLFLTADHASGYIPESLNNLGCDIDFANVHFGCDIGMGMMAEELNRQGAEILINNYSRAIIDPNRVTEDKMLIPAVQDSITIPANANISAENKQSRIDEIHRPYHAKLKECIDHHKIKDPQTLYIAVHSMEKQLEVDSMGHKTDGKLRPHMTFLVQDPDTECALAMSDFLKENGIETIGINDPYVPDPYPMFLWHKPHLPSILVEFRNDLIRTKENVQHYTSLLLKTIDHIKTNHPDLIIARETSRLAPAQDQSDIAKTGT